MKQFFRDYFTFNKRERNGVFILLSIILVLVLYLNLSSNFIKQPSADFSKFDADIKAFNASLQVEDSSVQERNEEPVTLTGSIDSNSGHFFRRENKQSKFVNKVQKIIELNTADSLQLVGLRGIGAFYAKTILKYRDALGGFYKKEQLLEVWKFDEEKFNQIKDYVSVDVTKIKKRNINTCTAKQLKMPYLDWNVVNAIVNYRNQHGNYQSVVEIKKTDLVTDELLRKLEPYLVVE